MSRNLKILGLALVAVFAMSVVVASSASATPFKFKSEGISTVLTAKQHAGAVQLKTDGGTVSCSTATYSGSLAGTETTEFDITPAYSGCTAFGFINVAFHTNGCKDRFTAVTKEGSNFRGSDQIICPSGKAMEITAPGCTVTIETQTPTGGTITYTKVGIGTTREITIDIALTGIHYIEHDTVPGGCVGPVTTTKTNGTETGSILLTGETIKTVHLGIWVE